MKLIDETTGTTSLNGGKIWIKAEIKDSTLQNQVRWDIESMKWATSETLSQDGLTYTASYEMTKDSVTIPGKQTLVAVLKVLGAANGEEITPEFTVWIEENEESLYKSITPETTYISAKPSYNIKLVRKGNFGKKVTVNYNDETKTGRMYGYSFIIQLYNEKADKGLKGVEYPKGDITFDIDLKLERTLSGSSKYEDITELCTPLLWNYKVNKKTDNGNIIDRTMNFTDDSLWEGSSVPSGIMTSDRKNCVYNSGNITMEQKKNKIQTTISNYDFDEIFPIYNNYYISSSNIVYGDNIGCFSVGYFQILLPDNEESLLKDRVYYLSVSDNNMKATSLSGNVTQKQIITNDDTSKVKHNIYTKGLYNVHLDFMDQANGIVSFGRGGDSYLAKGNNFIVRSYMDLNSSNDTEHEIYTANQILKFDGEAFEPIMYDSTKKFGSSIASGR